MQNNFNTINLRQKIQREEKKTKIITLVAILVVLITLIPIQTLFWLKNNTQEKPKWFSQTKTVEVEFEGG